MKMFLILLATFATSAASAGEMYTGKVKSLVGDNFDGYCAIDESDMLHCWGAEMFEVPTNLGPVKSVTIGGRPCAIDIKSRLRCWGQDDQGNPTPVPIEVKYAKSVSSDYWGRICAIDLAGDAYCWDTDEDTANQNYNLFKLPAEFNGHETILSFEEAACLTTATGKVNCWDKDRIFPVIAPKELSSTLDYGYDSIGCSVSLAGKVECSGYTVEATWNPKDGLKGAYDGSKTATADAIPAIFGKARDVSVGNSNACAVDELGIISCWSICTACYTNGLSTPTTQKVLRVVTGSENGCAILEDHTLTCWKR